EPYTNGGFAFLGSGTGRKLLHLVGSQGGDGDFPNQSNGGLVRRMDFSISKLNTLAIVTAEVATHKHVTRSQMGGNSTWIDFVGPSNSFPSIRFSQAYYGTYSGTAKGKPLPADFFKDKIVVVGATASNLQDI